MSPKMNVEAWLEFKPIFFEAAVQHFRQFTSSGLVRTSDKIFQYSKNIDKVDLQKKKAEQSYVSIFAVYCIVHHEAP